MKTVFCNKCETLVPVCEPDNSGYMGTCMICEEMEFYIDTPENRKRLGVVIKKEVPPAKGDAVCLSPGEIRTTKDIVDKYGDRLLTALNQMPLPGMKKGGECGKQH